MIFLIVVIRISKSFLLIINEFELHVDYIDVVLVDLLFVLQDLVTCPEFTEFQLHLFLVSHLFQFLRLKLYFFKFLVEGNSLPIHKAQSISITLRSSFLAHLSQIVKYIWLLVLDNRDLIRVLSFFSHFGSHLFGFLQIL